MRPERIHGNALERRGETGILVPEDRRMTTARRTALLLALASAPTLAGPPLFEGFDADEAVMRQQLRTMEPFVEDELPHVLQVGTHAPDALRTVRSRVLEP